MTNFKVQTLRKEKVNKKLGRNGENLKRKKKQPIPTLKGQKPQTLKITPQILFSWMSSDFLVGDSKLIFIKNILFVFFYFYVWEVKSVFFCKY